MTSKPVEIREPGLEVGDLVQLKDGREGVVVHRYLPEVTYYYTIVISNGDRKGCEENFSEDEIKNAY